MDQRSSAQPTTTFAVTCPGCGQRLRFAATTETPAKLRLQCSSCKTTFGVRRPGADASQLSATLSTTQPVPLPGAPAAPPPLRREGDEPGFRPGELIADRYQVVRFIARGGMGEVYEVEDLELRERVALKTVRPEAARDAVAVERFKREIQLARRVTHPNVCRIFDVSHHREGGGVIFLTMELLPGETLAQRLHRAGPMPPEEALPIARQITEALQAAHQAGVIHRDLKPGNIVLAGGRGGTRAVVTDFGLARLDAEGPAGQAFTLTAAAAVVGTPAYLAPEQVEGSEITPAVDIYALGVVLYEMLTGKVPFLGDNALSTAVKRLREAPVPPRTHSPALDPRWDAAILRCLERDPKGRFANALDVFQALSGPPAPQPVPEPKPPAPEAPATPPRPLRKAPQGRRRNLQVAGLAVLILLSFGIAYVRFLQWKEEQTAPVRQLRLPVGSQLTPRRSVAVLGFKDLSGRPETAWLSAALSEMLTTELGAGGRLRVVAGENVARAKVELRLGEADSLSRETLSRVRALLGTDAVVLGSYVALDGPQGRQIRLDLRLQDAAAGETTATLSETGSEAELFPLVSRAGRRLRREMGDEDPSETEGASSALPSNPEASRLYAEGISRLRQFDPVGARDLLARAVAAEPGNALAHSALATAWAALGYDGKAREEAKAALDLAGNLPREERLLIEGRYRETIQDWNRAVEAYWQLWSLFPDNLDHGLRFAAAQTAAGRVEEALATADALRTLPEPFRDDPRIDLAEAMAAGARSDFERQRAAAARAAEKGAVLGTPLMVAQARLLECRALRNLGQAGKALAACEEGRRLHAETGDRAGVAEALTHAANVRYDQGDLPAALRLYEEALGTYRELGNRGAEAGALNNIAVVLKNQGDLERALALYEEVLAVTQEIGSRAGEAYALNNLAGVLLRRGELGEAARLFERSLAIRREQQDRSGEAYALDNLGVALRRRGDLAAARRRHEEALAIRRQIGQKIGEVTSLNSLGQVFLDQGELTAARRSFSASLALSRQTGSRSGTANALFGLGEVLAREGRLAEARQRHEEALALRSRLGEKGGEAESRLALASVLLESGDAVRARDLARAAAAEFTRLGATEGEAVALALAAVASRSQDDLRKATSLVQDSEDLRARLTVEILAARLPDRNPKELLRRVAAQASQAGLLELRLESELALAELEDSRERLAALGQEAKALGYVLIARKAARAGGAV